MEANEINILMAEDFNAHLADVNLFKKLNAG